MPENSFLVLERKGAVAYVTLNRPEIHNAFNEQLIFELTSTITRLDQDSGVRVVVLKGAGRSFCAGADLNWMRQTVTYSYDQNLEDARKLAGMFEAIATCTKPVIAGVHGSAFGGGVGLIAAADISIAVESAEFCFSEVRLGILPAVIAPFVLARIGAGPARRYFLTAERFSAQEARRIGLLSEVVPDIDALELTVAERAEQILKGAPNAQSLCKQLISKITQPATKETMRLAVEAIAKARVSEEGQQGMRAFLEKQSPPWRSS